MVREGKLPGMLAVGLATAFIAVLARGQVVFVVIFHFLITKPLFFSLVY